MTSASSSRGSAHDNVSDLLRTAATTFPGRPAVIDAGRLLTWAELDRAADHGGRALVSAGLTLGDRVIVSLDTSADLIAALFAVARAGLVAVPISPAREEVGAVIERVAARGAIAGQPAVDAAVVISPNRSCPGGTPMQNPSSRWPAARTSRSWPGRPAATAR